MDKLTVYQQIRFECIIAAFEQLNVQIENEQQQSDPYQTADEMMEYILEGTRPIEPNLN